MSGQEKSKKEEWKFSSRAIHVGQEPEESFGAIIPPVYLTSTYVQEAPAEIKGYDYTRAGNPNFSNLEATLASLEHAKFATVFSSGLGALSGLLFQLKPGDRILSIPDLYGGSYRLFSKVFEKMGMIFDFCPIEDLEKTLSSDYKLLFIETPTNPLLKLVDIEALCSKAKKLGVLSVVDNTFASPYLQNPLLLGADAVLHSTTKYIGGHSDLIGGVMMTNDAELKEGLDFARMAVGLNPAPFDTWLTSRSVKTLAARLNVHCESAQALAEELEKHPKVAKVIYPGLKSHPDHELAKKQMRKFGGMISVEFDMGLEETKRLISSLELFQLAESLGGVESLVDHPASMTHASIPKAEREKAGLADGLVRFSVGIEALEDLRQDLLFGLLSIK